MLNLDETIYFSKYYLIQRDLYIKGVFFSIGVFVFLEIIRGQVAEINLLQLMPGLYIGLIFGCFILLMITSDLTFRFPSQTDSRKPSGTKTIFRMDTKLDGKFSFTLYSLGMFFTLNGVLPISLDSFNSYGEKTIESLWSFEELNSIETSLFITLIFIFQAPIIITAPLFPEKLSHTLFLNLRNYTFFMCIFSGVITPTVDIPTQLAFIFVGIILYFLVQMLLKKKSNINNANFFLT